MPVFEKILKYIFGGGVAVWIICISCWIVIFLDRNSFPSFEGLPEWVIPIVYILGILSTVACAFSLLSPTFNFFKLMFGRLIQPVQKSYIRHKLLRLDLHELLIISLAVEKMDKEFSLNRDHPVVLSLLDKGLIKSSFFGGFIVQDNKRTSFSIPQNVWKIILKMPEFQLPISSTEQASTFPSFPLQRAVDDKQSKAEIQKLLPQHHPAILK